MKVGIISDVHGNVVALTEVLDKLDDCDVLYCAGDIVGYYPFPNEVVELFLKDEIRSVMGNHDYAVVNNDFSGFNPYAEEAGRWTREHLKREYLEWLSELPIKIETQWFNIYHGAPADDELAFEVYLFPEDPMIEEFVRTLRVNLVVGHTHIQFLRYFDDLFFLNPGSVGQPRDGDSRAAFAVLNTETGKIVLRRVKYDIDEVCDAVMKAGLPEFLCFRLYEGW